MKAVVLRDCGVCGIPTHSKGQVIEVAPYVGPYGDVIPDLFQEPNNGFVWTAKDILIQEIPSNAP